MSFWSSGMLVNLWRKIQYLGLKVKKFSSNIIVWAAGLKSQFLKYIFRMPFLHPDEVQDCFQNVLQSILFIDDERINKFIEYIFQTYITKVANFLQNHCAEFALTTNRTTNRFEPFHSKLNNLFITGIPNVYNFIDILKISVWNMHKNTK